MQTLFQRFFGRFGAAEKPIPEAGHPEEVQVLVPEQVKLPLPKAPYEEICVPASINGRDLQSGQL
ncbi:hypothetical protein LH464_14255 [Neorhizobium sp. T786]|uniref:hypothetical protein n=1 Tax=Pseudorhizobium xiangyangii TaxID=2883104 RepID=UPI001D0016C5|nr:hypothetical protein [Neorhizobium xiangyangii]MCB5203637.1 hypothetical protein [Neorhizobium xiangyangii]